MTIVELINKFEPDDIGFQLLHECMVNIKSINRGVSEIRFRTKGIEPINVVADSGPVGLILWVDRKKWDAVASEIKKRLEEDPAATSQETNARKQSNGTSV